MDITPLVPRDSNYETLTAFFGYLLLIILIGIFSARFSSKGISNYFIGGRKMGMFVVALSAVVSGRSAWLLLGVTGMSYVMGISAIWSVLGYTIAEFFLFYYYAPRIRRFSEHFDCITVPDFYAERFDDNNGKLRIVVVCIIIIFMVAYVSAQFVAGGKAFHSSFQVSETTGLIFTVAIVLFYTMLGGFLAVSITDTIQGLFMVFALLVLPLIAIIHMGGIMAFFQMGIDIGGAQFFNPLSIGAGALIGFLGIGLGSPGNPHIIARYMSIKDPGKLKQVAFLGTAANFVMALGALTTGMAGRIFFPDVGMLSGSDPETVYPALAAQHLHPVLFGVVIASIFAAIMSTADSQLLVAASALIRDLYEKLWRKGEVSNQKLLVAYSRIAVVGLVLIAMLLGMFAGQLVFWLVLFAWAGLGAAFGPTTIMALFWKKTTKAGVMAGMVTGATVVIVWNRVSMLSGSLYELVPAFIAGLLVTIVVSLYTKPPQRLKESWDAMKP